MTIYYIKTYNIMASYLPPTEELPIFDNSVFQSNDEPITFSQATTEFLRFPIAQGTETFNNPTIQKRIDISPDVLTVSDYGNSVYTELTPITVKVRDDIGLTDTIITPASISSNTWSIDSTGNPYFGALPSLLVYTIPSPTFDIDLLNVQNLTYTMDMNSKIAGLTFSNGIVNGNYKIYMTGITGEIFYKNSCQNNLLGDTVIGVGSFWILTVYYTGSIYVVNCQDYT
jgi:hypothetical protein